MQMSIIKYSDVDTKLTKKVDHIFVFLYPIKSNNNIWQID